MTGPAFALLCAICFAATNICTRRGVLRVKDAGLGGYISVFVGLPLFLLIGLFAADIYNIGNFTWLGYLWLALAGIIHFVLGRTFTYWGVKFLGANMSSIFASTSLVYTVLLGFLVLGERVTPNTVIGALLIIIGPILLVWSFSKRSTVTANNNMPGLSTRGITCALLGGLFYGSSSLLIKWGLQQGGSSLSGTFISYSGAAFILGMTMFHPARRDEIVRMEHGALLWFILGGIFVGLAQLFRFTAFTLSPISLVGPLTNTHPLFILIFSLVMNRGLESFRPNVIIGAVLVVAGAFLLYV